MAEVYQSRHKGYEIDNILDGAKPIIEGGLSANKILMSNNELLPTYLASNMASKDYVQEEIEKSKGIVAKARLVIKSIYETNTRPEDAELGDLYEFNKVVVINEGFTVVHQQATHEDIDIVLELDGGHKYHVKQYGVIGSKETLLDDEVVTLYGGDYREIWVNSFTTKTWAGIKRIVNAGKTHEYFQVGDEIDIDVESPVHLDFTVVGIDIYEEHELTIMTDECLTLYTPYDDKDASTHCWKDSNVQKYLNEDVFSHLPVDMQHAISSKENMVYMNNQPASTTMYYLTHDKLWLPSAKELFGITNPNMTAGYDYISIWNHDKVFPFFTSNTTRIKGTVSNGTGVEWWTRSMVTNAYNTSSSKNHLVFTVGAAGVQRCDSSATGNFGLPFFFCIRKDKEGEYETNSQSE